MFRHTFRFSIFAFSQAYPNQLVSNSSSNSTSLSNTWIEFDKRHSTINQLVHLTPASIGKIKQSELNNFTSIEADRVIEFYNIDCLASEPIRRSAEERSIARNHDRDLQISFSSNNPFSHQLNEKLSQLKYANNFKSNIWITSDTAKLRNLRMGRYLPDGKHDKSNQKLTRPAHVLFTKKTAFVNASQFENPEAIQRYPVSAYRCLPFVSDHARLLSDFVKEHQYSTGLFFSEQDLEFYGLRDQLRQNAKSKTIEKAVDKTRLRRELNVSSQKYKIFNVHTLVGGARILARHYHQNPSSTPPTDHTFLFSGKKITDPELLKNIENHPKNFTCKFWVTHDDMEKHKLAPKPGCANTRAVVLPGYEKVVDKLVNFAEGKMAKKRVTDVYYNCEELIDPDVGFRIAGRKARDFFK